MCTQAICTVCSKPVDTHDKTCPHCNDGEPLNYRVIETRSEEHTSELQSHSDLVCRLLLEKKKFK